MSIRVRALFFASLALVVGDLTLPGQGSTASTADAAAPVLDPVPVHHEPHPASYGARGWLPDRPADKRAERLADASLAPSQPARHPLPAVDVQAAEPPRSGPRADPLLLLPPSRAPPALS